MTIVMSKRRPAGQGVREFSDDSRHILIMMLYQVCCWYTPQFSLFLSLSLCVQMCYKTIPSTECEKCGKVAYAYCSDCGNESTISAKRLAP